MGCVYVCVSCVGPVTVLYHSRKKVTKARDCSGLLEYAPKLTYGIARCISCPDLTLDFKVKATNVMPKKE